jgi:hypothetical protein
MRNAPNAVARHERVADFLRFCFHVSLPRDLHMPALTQIVCVFERGKCDGSRGSVAAQNV